MATPIALNVVWTTKRQDAKAYVSFGSISNRSDKDFRSERLMLDLYDSHKVVILDQDTSRRELLKSLMIELGYLPLCFDNETICCENLEVIAPDVVFCMTNSTEGAFRRAYAVKLIDPQLPLVLISNFNGFFKEIREVFGNVACLSLPVDARMLKDCMDGLLQNQPESGYKSFSPLVGTSREISAIRKMVKDLGAVGSSVFIIGEKGSGRELIARTIVANKTGEDCTFVKLDAEQLAAIEDGSNASCFSNILELEQFIAGQRRVTILVSEIDTMPQDFQAHLLLLVDKTTGSPAPGFSNDVNFIVTAKDRIAVLVETDQFRKDLYFRLNVMTVNVPPLRSRRADINLLADFFTYKYCLEFKRSFFRISPMAKAVFNRYHWPGNVAELENTIKRIVSTGNEKFVLEAPPFVDAAKPNDMVDMLNSLPGTTHIIARLREMIDQGTDFSLRGICEDFVQGTERHLIQKALEQTNWNRKRAAGLLKISYKSMLNKIKEYNIA